MECEAERSSRSCRREAEDDVNGCSSKRMRTEIDSPSGSIPDIEINSELLSLDFIEKCSKSWEGKQATCPDENVTFYNDPFQLCKIHNFLQKPELINNIVEEMASMEWTRKQMDLYEFYQCTDLSNITTPFLKNFYRTLKEDVMPLVSKISGMEFTHLSASCSMYDCGDYLLVHDDLLSDRQVAFVFYVSPWEDAEKWTSEMGGCLEIFKSDENELPIFPVVNKIVPQNNQFIFFKVGKKSFHQVGEVTSYDFPRLTINGWFHSSKNKDIELSSKKLYETHIYKEPQSSSMELNEIINDNYLKRKTKLSVRNYFEQTSEMRLDLFLKSDVLNNLVESLKADDLKWTRKGPANVQNYLSLSLDSVSGSIADIMSLLTSNSMFAYLTEITQLDLLSCYFEIQKWNQGCYTVLGDKCQYADNSLDITLYLTACDNVGVVSYLCPDPENEETEDSSEEELDDPILLTVTPKANTLNMAYVLAGTAKFTKYVFKKTVLPPDESVYMIFCSYKILD